MKYLIDWCLEEMVGRSHAGLGHLAGVLSAMPLRPGVPVSSAAAGIPFEMPYSLALPLENRSRWRLQLAMLDASDELLTTLTKSGAHNDILGEYAATNYHEFWAVAVEVFLENPVRLRHELGSLYEALAKVLNQDPVASLVPRQLVTA